jgi:hypothetical protein
VGQNSPVFGCFPQKSGCFVTDRIRLDSDHFTSSLLTVTVSWDCGLWGADGRQLSSEHFGDDKNNEGSKESASREEIDH